LVQRFTKAQSHFRYQENEPKRTQLPANPSCFGRTRRTTWPSPHPEEGIGRGSFETPSGAKRERQAQGWPTRELSLVGGATCLHTRNHSTNPSSDLPLFN
jgi:hypothetical protein